VADRVTVAPAHLFSGFDHYYATLVHELSHKRALSQRTRCASPTGSLIIASARR